MRPTLRHRLINALHSILLVGGMASLAWICTALIWGSATAIWVFVFTGVMLVLASSALPVDLVTTIYGAQRITAAEFPQGIEMLRVLAKRAELSHVPAFFYLPSMVPNAFTTGSGTKTAIIVSDGLLRTLGARELAAVLAHEISHIANGDMWIMRMADVMGRIIAFTAFAGQLMLIINLPLALMGAAHIPWATLLLLVFSPTVMSLLQLALSRSREFDADLAAARLTGDPAALVSALERLEHSTGSFWEEILLPGRRIPVPSLLRSHPPLEARVARLREVAAELFRTNPPRLYSDRPGDRLDSDRPEDRPARNQLPPEWVRVVRKPRWRRSGLWY